jgi:hypothetical protein
MPGTSSGDRSPLWTSIGAATALYNNGLIEYIEVEESFDGPGKAIDQMVASG